MRSFWKSLRAHVRFRAAAYAVLIVALVPTLFAHWRVLQNVRARAEARFVAEADHVQEVLGENLRMMFASLNAISGLFEASTAVTSEEWDVFISKLELPIRYAGLRSVGYSPKVSASERDVFTASVRKSLPDFTIRPPSDLPVSFPTVFSTYFFTNAVAPPGWDAMSDPVRSQALEALLRDRKPQVTGKVHFWSGDYTVPSGFTLYMPVTKGASAASVAPAEVSGAVFVSVIPQRMLEALGSDIAGERLALTWFDSAGEHRAALGVYNAHRREANPAFRREIALHLLDRTFLLEIETLPGFDAKSEARLPWFALACGMALSLTFFGITWVQTSSRAHAVAWNRQLRLSEEQLRAANTELQRRVSEAQLAEKTLAHERDLLRTLLDHSPDRIYFKDRESRFIKCGKAVVERLGMTNPDDALGKTDFDFFTEEHARPAREMERNILATGQPVIGLIERESWTTGEETWVLTSKMPLHDNEGNIIGTFGISKDVTALKRAELELEQEKELLAVTLRSIGDGVITTDTTGRVVLMNAVAEKVTGWMQSQAIGRLLPEVFETRTDIHETRSTTLLITRHGEELKIAQTVAPIVDQQGCKRGAVLVFRDITEQLRIEAELLKASKLESIGVLAGGIAHDFNNILTVILGNLSLARMAELTGNPASEALAEAEKASLRARELTQRLLTFAKGGAPIRKPLEVAPLVRDCVNRTLHGTGIVPEFYVSEGLWLVDADESQLGQVVQNLLNHARASLSKDPRLDVHVLNQEIASDPLLLLAPGRYVRISIRDFGGGLEGDHLHKIFEPYFGGKKGGGLELATAYSIVRKHDGQIRVESISGQGTVFHVYLPATNAPVSCAPARLAHEDRPALARRRVLVMDDEPGIRGLAVALLEHLGMQVETAADGQQAIELYESARKRGEPFDLTIMDLTVPNGMGGKETIRQLRMLDPNVVAIVSSGYSNDPVMANFRDYGFAGVVPKPYSSADLAAAIEELFTAEAVA